jgi:hypothetical protein
VSIYAEEAEPWRSEWEAERVAGGFGERRLRDRLPPGVDRPEGTSVLVFDDLTGARARDDLEARARALPVDRLPDHVQLRAVADLDRGGDLLWRELVAP